MGISIQMLHNMKMFGFVYWNSILGWYGQPCHEQLNGKGYGCSTLGWYNESRDSE